MPTLTSDAQHGDYLERMPDTSQARRLSDVPLGVTPVVAAAFRVDSDVWPYAARNAEAIDANWQKATVANPLYFNGVVHLTQSAQIKDGCLDASLVRTDFKSYLFWRGLGFPDAGVLDGFGSGLIRTGDGDVILGRQRSGNVNAGLVYLPAGFIDASDVDANGGIDIAKAVLREIVEETGVEAEGFSKEPEFFVARSGAQLSIAVPFRVVSSTASFVAAVDKHIAKSSVSELEAVVAVSTLADIADLPLPAYTRVLLESLLR